MPFARNRFVLIVIMPADKHRIVAKLRNKDHVRPLVLAQLTFSSPFNFGSAIRVSIVLLHTTLPMLGKFFMHARIWCGGLNEKHSLLDHWRPNIKRSHSKYVLNEQI